jgi:GTP-binding protein
VLLTKADKLSRQAAQRQLTETRDALSRLYPSASVQLFSSASLLGLDEARQALARLLDGHEQPERGPTAAG